MIATIRNSLFVLLLCQCAACAETQTPETSFASGSTPVLELPMTRSDGQRVELSAMSGRPRLLFLFATYDEASQFALVPITRLAETEKRVQVIGLALQPDAKTFIKLFKEALSLPFDLYCDPDNHVLQKQTALGALLRVPALVALDAEGRIRGVHYGVANQEELQTLVSQSLEH